MSAPLLQVAELKRKYQFTYRIVPEENGDFIVPDIMDMTFVRFDRISIVTDFRRKHFGSSDRVDNTAIFGEHTWSQSQIAQELVDAGIRYVNTANFDPVVDGFPILSAEATRVALLRAWGMERHLDGCIAIQGDLNIPKTELFNQMFPGEQPLLPNTPTIRGGDFTDVPIFIDIYPPDTLKLFSVDMIQPTTLWAGQNQHKVFDFAANTPRNVIIVRNEGKAVDDVPIRNDGLPMILRIRDMEENYVLNKRQLGSRCVMELNISGGIL